MIKLPEIKLKCKLESKRWLNECECLKVKIFIPDFVLQLGENLEQKVWVTTSYLHSNMTDMRFAVTGSGGMWLNIC